MTGVFQANQTPNLTCLGAIHRGTPWQTMYLKSGGVDSHDLAKLDWCSSGPWKAQRLQPTNDWRLASLLAGLFNTNDSRSLLSVNETDLGDGWLSWTG